MNQFDDIRPYIDAEVPEVMERLLKNEDFINSVMAFELPRMKKAAPKLASKVVKKKLVKKLGHVRTIADGQKIISAYVDQLLEKSSTGLKVEGLNESSQTTAHLFISNHRDIVMDPALISSLMHDSVHGTVQIAIGDNLLKQDYVSDLMRLNKSFIVKRSVQGREKLVALKQLSEYIHYCIREKNNVWIAQREGRAKNSIDKTDPTILKMLHIANRGSAENYTLKDTINQLHIIPVSISYEYDPCATMKALELYEIDKNGRFEKNEKSDLTSISTGMHGQKGNIHLYFGKEIVAISDEPNDVAKNIDTQIVSNYKLHQSNYIAYDILQKENSDIGEALDITISETKRKEFSDMLNEVAPHLRPYFLKIYANPVIHKKEFVTETII